MSKLFTLLSHKITDEQKNEVYKNLHCSEIIYLDNDLQQLWSNIPPYSELPLDILNILVKYLTENTLENDYILIQGDFGAVFYIVDWAIKNNRIPIYATTQRIYQQEINPDGSIKNIHIFKHINFRKYLKY